MRATAQDHEAAYAMGVNADRVFNIAFALASLLGGAAGVLVGIYYNAVSATMGGMAGLKGFAACIFGGLTSIPGAILGSLIIGVVENLTVQFIASGYRDIVGLPGDGDRPDRPAARTSGQQDAGGVEVRGSKFKVEKWPRLCGRHNFELRK